MTQIIENLSTNVILNDDKPLNINGNNIDLVVFKAKKSDNTFNVGTSSGKRLIYYVN